MEQVFQRHRSRLVGEPDEWCSEFGDPLLCPGPSCVRIHNLQYPPTLTCAASPSPENRCLCWTILACIREPRGGVWIKEWIAGVLYRICWTGPSVFVACAPPSSVVLSKFVPSSPTPYVVFPRVARNQYNPLSSPVHPRHLGRPL